MKNNEKQRQLWVGPASTLTSAQFPAVPRASARNAVPDFAYTLRTTARTMFSGEYSPRDT